MTRCIMTFFVLICFVASCAAFQAKNDIEEANAPVILQDENISDPKHVIDDKPQNVESVKQEQNSDAEDALAKLEKMKKDAENGSLEAQLSLGRMYMFGEGVIRDFSESAKWYRMAAEKGNDKAQLQLGGLYYNGNGVDRDYSEAFKWFKLAAEQRDAKAQVILGHMYKEGIGASQNIEKAIKWYKIAAEQGNADAQSALGGIFSFADPAASPSKDPASPQCRSEAFPRRGPSISCLSPPLPLPGV